MILASAYLLDLLIGDPAGWPHPVRTIGRLIAALSETALRTWKNPAALKAAGVMIVITTVGLTWLVAWLILDLASVVSPNLAFILGVVMAWTTLATHGLYHQTWRVARAAMDDDLPRARKLLGLVVGRDTHHLGRPEILRAVLETIAENLSDGVIAPLFYLALGGPALGLAYKAVNTLDSMIGYKSEKYLHLGWAAARLDDAVNFIPARISAVLIVVAAWILGLDARDSFRTWLRDGGSHTSPNAGRPEAALAGALGITLGGQGTYGGVLVVKPTLGRGNAPLKVGHVRAAENILLLSSGLMLGLTSIWEALF